MESARISRKQHRRLFTKACNDFYREETELSTDDKITKLRLIGEKAKHLIVIEEQCRQMLFESNESEDIIEKEIDESESYIDKWRVLEQKLNKLKISEKVNCTVIENAARSLDLIHYPKLKLPTFDGNVRNWLNFWGQFQKIDNDSSLDDHDKFAFLLQSMEKGSPAEELIKSYPPGGMSYDRAVKQLKARFGKDELLIEIYVRDLLALVLQKHNANKCNSLRKLYDNLESKLRALETLGVAREKYAAMLFPLVESALPEEVLRTWERYRSAHRRSKDESENDSEMNSQQTTDLDRILYFLQDEVEGEERISLVTQSFENVKDAGRSGGRHGGKPKFKESALVPSATDLLTSSRSGLRCIFCNHFHKSGDCNTARKLSLEERQSAVEKSRSCFLCLRTGHGIVKCKMKTCCLLCGKKHHILLCRNLSPNETNFSNDKQEEESREPNSRRVEALANLSRGPNVLLQTLIVTLKGPEKQRTVRAIIDSASQRSYILKSTASDMNYKAVGKEYLRHSLFGGTSTSMCEHDVFKIYLSNESGTYNCQLSALSQTKICETFSPVARGPLLKELSSCGVHLSDNREGPIGVLIGADVAGKLLTGMIKRLPSGLTAIETKLGWTIMGRMEDNSSNKSTDLIAISMLNKGACIEDLWALDSLGITDPSERKTKLELHEEAKQHFLNTVKVENGRFLVHLPWIEDHTPLPSNFDLALKRLNSLVRKLEIEGLYRDYENVFIEWLQEGIIEEVPIDEVENSCHYLPHRHIIKENSTTRLRPVFDASAKKKGSSSLNECLEKGLNLIELIPTVLTRFRMENIGVIPDIRKAFLQISLFPKDRDFLRFLWNGNDGHLKYYRHCRVVFGISSSPFLIGSKIQYHMQSILQSIERGESTYSEDVIRKFMCSFYVDNCVTSVKNEAELHHFIKVATNIMADRKFDLRGWEYTRSELPLTAPINVLGMLWYRDTDVLQVHVGELSEICLEKVTKRIILSTAHKIFDPLGITCPVVLFPKLLLQRLWKTKMTWDQEVDLETKKGFLKWIKGIPHLANIKIPRCIKGGDDSQSGSLHIFCDASRFAYATAIYLRVEDKESVKVQLVQAKARVSPCGKRETSIARLELLGATIAARLASVIIDEFEVEKVYYWTDSTTVLAWISREESWGTFVQNRVQEIRNLTTRGTWKFVPGSMNPADLPSRGCSANHLLKSNWWEGPEWLYLSREKWPMSNSVANEEEVASEKKKKIVSSFIAIGISALFNTRFTDYGKILRVSAWVKRFIFNCRNKQRRINEISELELSEAEKSIIRLIQLESFEGIDDKRLKSLLAFFEDGIIRIKTGVFRREDDVEFRTPAVLPGEHPIVKSLILKEHTKKGHTGVSYVLNSLREKFWLLCGRRNVRSVVRNCVVCKRYTAKCVNPPQFIPPGAPWWGDWWERLVEMMKHILKKVLGRASLSYEEMLTVLCNCEAILNDRPLTTVTSDPDFLALTPANFPKEIKNDRVPNVCENLDSNKLRRRLHYIETVREAFRRRFRQEYLGTLKGKQKNSKISSINPGDIVLVGGEDKKRLTWPLGRVLELFPGADGISRRARIKTEKGILIRALQSLYPLEISSTESGPNLQQGVERPSKGYFLRQSKDTSSSACLP